jgi:GNAT superfamily N-acetyltransferase
MDRPRPRDSEVSVPLPENATHQPDIFERLNELRPLNNLGIFANVPQCFLSITSPGYRRQGLGREALRALFAECERRRGNAVHVEAGRDNVAAAAALPELRPRRFG